MQVASRGLDPISIGLVYREHVGDFQKSGLVRLYRIAPTGVHHHHGGIRLPGDLHFDLSDANGLHDHPVVTRCIQQTHGFARRQRQATEVSTRCHRADVHLVVVRVILHSHSVAENRATRVRRRRIDGQHADPCAPFAQLPDQRRRERALTGTRRTGDSHHICLTYVRTCESGHRPRIVTTTLDQRQQPSQGTAIAGCGSTEQLRRIV